MYKYNLKLSNIGDFLDINEYIKKISSINFDKRTRIILLIIYALIMFTTIQSEINTIVFILLFAVVPIAIYFFVKSIFPTNKS